MTLRDRYREEMDYLRQQGQLFARDNPRLARFLGSEANDPDVERLLEGFAFLTARLRLKLEDDLPEVTHSLLQLLWPNYLRPLPSATIIRFDPLDRAITKRQVIPKGTPLLSIPVDGVACQFRTCADVMVDPLVIDAVSDAHSREASILHLDLATLSGQALRNIDGDTLDVHFSGDDTTALTLYLWMARYLDAVEVTIGEDICRLSPSHVTFPGFVPEEALLPYPANVFDGYRILQEYFIFPRRFYFMRLQGVQALWAGSDATHIRLTFRFNRPMPAGTQLSRNDLALHCVPAINLFAHGAEPIRLDGRAVDYQVMPMGPQPETYEIFSIDQVAGWADPARGNTAHARLFHPFESFQHTAEQAQGRTALYYRTRLIETSDAGSIMHRIALVRGDEQHYVGSDEALSIDLTCTNGELPHALSVGDISVPTDVTPSFATYTNLTVPTPSYRPVLDGALHWTLISNLSLNYLSLLSAEPLKAVLRAYDFAALHDIQRARATRQRLDGVSEATTTPMDLLMQGMPVRGLRTELALDPAGFLCEGDLYLFASVLAHFFALYASVNAFHQLDVVNVTNHERYSWPPLQGKQPVI